MLNLRLSVVAMLVVAAMLTWGCERDEPVYPDLEREVDKEEVEGVIEPPDGELYPEDPEEEEPVTEADVVDPPDDDEQQ